MNKGLLLTSILVVTYSIIFWDILFGKDQIVKSSEFNPSFEMSEPGILIEYEIDERIAEDIIEKEERRKEAIAFLLERIKENHKMENELLPLKKEGDINLVISEAATNNTNQSNDTSLRDEKITEEKKPTRLIYPSKNIESPIKEVGLNDRGEMDVIDDAITIGWYKYGATPGQNGNAILSGHRDWKGKRGPLYQLEKHQIGEKMQIEYDDGSKRTFTLVSLDTYRYDFVPKEVMSQNGETRTTVITCGGPFINGSYQSRVVAVYEIDE